MLYRQRIQFCGIVLLQKRKRFGKGWNVKYEFEEQEKNGWFVREDAFDNRQLGKCESIFYLGNGYMGVRSATEEPYLQETRGMFVSGTFNKFDEKEVTELPNLPDVIRMELFLDGEPLDLSCMTYEDYERTLNMREGELVRKFTVHTSRYQSVRMTFRRVVSLCHRHTIAQKVTVCADGPIELQMRSGIDGGVTNSGYQHLSVLNKRFYDGRILQANYRTTQSQIMVSLSTMYHILVDGQRVTEQFPGRVEMDSRGIYMNYRIHLEAGRKLDIEKISTVYTDRDLEFSDGAGAPEEYGRTELLREADKGYSGIRAESAGKWQRDVWDRQDIKIISEHPVDQLAVRFAIFHMVMMTPGHDNRMNIGAKALSGEGYKGHTFWDTEMFLLPFWIYTYPKTARSLLEYRYLGLDGARRKAKDNGYEGAMYPWESAWITDGEVTPRFGAADVMTGEELPIICGDIEQHITSDVAFGVWQYYQLTEDRDFMERYGYEIIFDTARYWASRVEWKEERHRYEICNVIGPDEYSEHVNNNAYTNYMAQWNMKLAMDCYERCGEDPAEWFCGLRERLELDQAYKKWKQVTEHLYLPQVNEDKLLPQDDDYLKYPVIPLQRYKESATRADIIKDYNMEQLAHMQVSKQADVVLLFCLMGQLFPADVKLANFQYYEDKCLHDSSLSLSVHAIMAGRLGMADMAYEFFRRAAMIDLGPDMNSPTDGIHAASMGGIWQCVVHGFAGVHVENERLIADPCLPAQWQSVQFALEWKGTKLSFLINKDRMEIATEGSELELECAGRSYRVSGKAEIIYA